MLLKCTNTNPAIIHGNGNGKKTTVYNTLKDRQFARTDIDVGISSDVTFISWKGGNVSSQKTILEKSVEQYGGTVYNLPWKKSDGFWRESQQKVTLTLDAIERGDISTKYVYWLDNTDVFFLESPDLILNRFLDQYGSGFIFNAEKNDFPRPGNKKYDQIPKSFGFDEWHDKIVTMDNSFNSTPYRYMNSGAGLGDLETLHTLLKTAKKYIQNSRIPDQFLMRISQFIHCNICYVDKGCEYFFSTWNAKEEEVTYE